ncbi:malate dehydrogenase [Atractiella rhizophila]|nr:malate dehydrogenase [Atractiella rhizophila]
MKLEAFRSKLHIHETRPVGLQHHEREVEVIKEAGRCLVHLRSIEGEMQKYNYLASLRTNNHDVFYRLLIENLSEITPLIYTPTIGTVCETFSQLPPPLTTSHPALYLSLKDKGRLESIIANFQWKKNAPVDMIVVTDGSRILGLGDLGVGGIGIPIGKLSLYVGGAGLHPERTLPVVLDYGTSTKRLLEDPNYIGLREERIPNAEAKEFVREFLHAVHKRWDGQAIVQFEDFNTELAFELLEENWEHFPCFNDDIQGTGAVTLAGLINAFKMSGTPVQDQKVVFFGAGSAAVGIAEMIVDWLVDFERIERSKAKEMIWLVDSKGLIADNRGDTLPPHKRSLSRSDPQTPKLKSLLEVVQHVKPTALLGLSTVGGSFTEEVLKLVKSTNARPIIFPLSNPVRKSECTYEQALAATDGTCIFASGSPFQPVEWEGSLRKPGQCNNFYVFPGIGLGAVNAQVSTIPKSLIQIAAMALAASLTPEEKSKGLIYPELERIRDISAEIAREVIRGAQDEEVDRNSKLRDMEDPELNEYIRAKMYHPGRDDTSGAKNGQFQPFQKISEAYNRLATRL